MIIAVSARGKEKESLLDSRFGRCDYFQIYNEKGECLKVIENQGIKVSGGAGIAAANQLIEEKVEVLLTGKLGPNAFEIVEKAEIKAYECRAATVENTVKDYFLGQLSPIRASASSHNGLAE